MAEYRSIKNWADDDKPREKLARQGRQNLSNAELLAILIGSGTRSKSAVDLARELLQMANNNINELARFTIKDLCQVNGIGPAKAITLIAAVEIAARRELDDTEDIIIRSSNDAFKILSPILKDKTYEEFWILALARNNKVIKSIKISDGGVSGTVADPKRIFKNALYQNATSIILSHNHPSGNLNPSSADIQLTTKLKEAGKQLDIAVLDHIIVSSKGYYSFADEGKI